jgi:hypothetical protein
MAGLFNPPQMNMPTPPNPYDTQNRLADALTRRLQTGGTQGDTLSNTGPGRGLGLPGGGGASMPAPTTGATPGGSNMFAGLSARTGLSG